MKKEDLNKAYWSCSYIESGITMQNVGLMFCCERENPGFVAPKEDPVSTIDAFLVMREQVVELNQQTDAPCKGCPLFQKRKWKKGVTEYKIDFINFGVQSYCQFSCIYCGLQRNRGLKEGKNRPEPYDSISIAKELKNRNMLSERLKIDYAAGEIAIHPKRKEYFEFIEENAYIATFSSNAGIYDDQVARILQKSKRNSLIVSIDAGTNDTFQFVRGVRAFKTVIANLKKYSEQGAQIYLKYIILNENCGQDDVDGFIDICNDIGIVEMSVSGDFTKTRDFKKETFYEQNIVETAVQLVQKAIQKEIPFRLINYLGDANLKKIYGELYQLPKIRQCSARLDVLLQTPNLISYGAGKNCEVLLETWNSLDLQKPAVIWDIAAPPSLQDSETPDQDDGCPIHHPNFEGLDNEEDAVFITITNGEVNKEIIANMHKYGFDAVMSQYDVSLALIAKQALLNEKLGEYN